MFHYEILCGVVQYILVGASVSQYLKRKNRSSQLIDARRIIERSEKLKRQMQMHVCTRLVIVLFPACTRFVFSLLSVCNRRVIPLHPDSAGRIPTETLQIIEVGNGWFPSFRSVSSILLLPRIRGGLGIGRFDFRYAAFTASHFSANEESASSGVALRAPQIYGSTMRAVNQTRSLRTDSRYSTPNPPIRFALFMSLPFNYKIDFV